MNWNNNFRKLQILWTMFVVFVFMPKMLCHRIETCRTVVAADQRRFGRSAEQLTETRACVRSDKQTSRDSERSNFSPN